jgi:hypothetical protein
MISIDLSDRQRFSLKNKTFFQNEQFSQRSDKSIEIKEESEE